MMQSEVANAIYNLQSTIYNLQYIKRSFGKTKIQRIEAVQLDFYNPLDFYRKSFFLFLKFQLIYCFSTISPKLIIPAVFFIADFFPSVNQLDFTERTLKEKKKWSTTHDVQRHLLLYCN
jgi:hypothetical protein